MQGLKFGVWLLALLAIPIIAGVTSSGSAGLSYATSGSMEPLIRQGDGFLVWPVAVASPGEIIVFRPKKLPAERVVHRVVAVTPLGYITRGDNVDHTDQAAGEPPIKPERLVGRVVTYDGQPVVFRGVSGASQWVRDVFGRNVRIVVIALLAVAGGMYAVDFVRPTRQRSLRVRWRTGHLYAGVCGAALLLICFTMFVGSGVRSVDYLSSTNPGTLPIHVKAGAPGLFSIPVGNAGFLPVYPFAEALGEITVEEVPSSVGPRSSGSIALSAPARPPGWYREYVRLYLYPPFLPRTATAWLHGQSPVLAMSANALGVALLFLLLSRTIDLWVPLKGRPTPVGLRMRRLYRMAWRGRRAP